MPDIPSCVNWNSAAPVVQHLNNLPVVMGSEISILAQISEYKDPGFVPFATTKLQVAAESGSVVNSNLRWPQSY